MGIKIVDMTPVTSVSGVEIIPVSKDGAPKSMTATDVEEFTIDQIEAISAGTAVTGSDSVFILQGGALKPVDIDLVAQHAIDTIWGKTAETVVDAADIIALKDGGTTEKTVTTAILATYISTAIKAGILNLSLLDAGATLGDDDILLVCQGTTGKRTTLSAINTAIYGALAAYVTGLTLVTTPADADLFYMLQGGLPYNVTLAKLKAVMGTTTAPASTTENSVPQWAAASKTLKDGLTVQATVRDAATATNTAVATEKAIRDALTVSVYGSYADIWVPATTMIPSETDGAGETAGKVVYWDEFASSALTRACLIFDGSAQDESAEFDIVMPSDWDLLFLKFKAFWTSASGASADDYIQLSLAAGLVGNNVALDAVIGAAIPVVDQVVTDEYLHVSPASEAITLSGSGTAAISQMAHFKLTRDYDYNGAGLGSAMTENLLLFGIQIQYQRASAIAAW